MPCAREVDDAQVVTIKEILQRSKGLVGFPVETVVEIVTELGSYIPRFQRVR